MSGFVRFCHAWGIFFAFRSLGLRGFTPHSMEFILFYHIFSIRQWYGDPGGWLDADSRRVYNALSNLTLHLGGRARAGSETRQLRSR
jgi:hypothetical protein